MACEGFGTQTVLGTLGQVPDTPTYSEHIAPLMEVHCDECHSDPATQGAPDYFRTDVYDSPDEPGLFETRHLNLERMVNTPSRPMPPTNLPPMSAIELETFALWVDLGAPFGPSDTGVVLP